MERVKSALTLRGISAVYAKAFHQLLRLLAGFLPLFPLPVPRKLLGIEIQPCCTRFKKKEKEKNF